MKGLHFIVDYVTLYMALHIFLLRCFMKNKSKKFYIFLAAICTTIIVLGIVIFASLPKKDSEPSGTQGILYQLNDSESAYTVIGYEGTSRNVVIPSKHKGLPVTTVGNNAFAENEYLKSIEIGNNVTTIGRNAFDYCIFLLKVSMHDSVTILDSMAFSSCIRLTEITLSKNITTIKASAFYGCSALPEIKLGDKITTMERNAFSYCEKLQSVNLPNSLTSIGANLFYGCPLLTISCEATEKPSTWPDNWNIDYSMGQHEIPVVWGSKGE